MKIRIGFVSNSSSTSYTVLFPRSFKPKSINWTKYQKSMDDHEVDEASCVEALKQLIKKKELYYSEAYSESNVLMDVLIGEGFVIGGQDTGPDEGQFILADICKIEKILGITGK